LCYILFISIYSLHLRHLQPAGAAGGAVAPSRSVDAPLPTLARDDAVSCVGQEGVVPDGRTQGEGSTVGGAAPVLDVRDAPLQDAGADAEASSTAGCTDPEEEERQQQQPSTVKADEGEASESEAFLPSRRPAPEIVIDILAPMRAAEGILKQRRSRLEATASKEGESTNESVGSSADAAEGPSGKDERRDADASSNAVEEGENAVEALIDEPTKAEEKEEDTSTLPKAHPEEAEAQQVRVRAAAASYID
jgi:hypothetical protein